MSLTGSTRNALLVLLVAGVAPGCALTEDEVRHANAMERLEEELPAQLDRLLERWSAAGFEANRTSEEVYRLRLERLLRDKETLFAVRTGLRVEDETIVATCAAAIGFSTAKGIGADLLPLLEHEEPAIRGNAAMALYLLGGRDCAIPEAAALLADPDAGVREQAALLLARVLRAHADKRAAGGETGPPADDAYYGALLGYYESLSDLDEQVRVNVAQGMGVIGNPAASSVLVERGLQDPSARVRYASAQAIAQLRPASEAENILGALGREFNAHVKRELHQALRAITDLDIGDIEEWKRRVPEWRDARDNPKPAKPAAAQPHVQPPVPSSGGAASGNK